MVRANPSNCCGVVATECCEEPVRATLHVNIQKSCDNITVPIVWNEDETAPAWNSQPALELQCFDELTQECRDCIVSIKLECREKAWVLEMNGTDLNISQKECSPLCLDFGSAVEDTIICSGCEGTATITVTD